MSSAVKLTSYKSRNVFDDYQIIFHRIFFLSFPCEKTTMKISWPVNELFSQVVINFKKNVTILMDGGEKIKMISCFSEALRDTINS